MAESYFGQPLTLAGMRPRVGDLRQIGSVRAIVLDDGPERGVRALAFSTGGGLDFWVLTDRSFDIGPLWYRGIPIAWQGANGFRSPALHDAADDDGHGFTRSFSGLLVTCGLDHVRQPAAGKPLHGRLPFTPGRLLAYGEDWNSDEPVLFCEGEVTQARFGGETLRLRRRIEAPIGGAMLRIFDRVENIGAEPQPLALLYHMNFGFPAVADGSRIFLGAEPIAGPLHAPDANAEPTVTCFSADTQRGGECSVATPVAEADAWLTLRIGYDPAALKFVQLWQDLRPHRHVVAVEPCTSDRNPDGTSAPGPVLAAGSTRDSWVSFSAALGPAS